MVANLLNLFIIVLIVLFVIAIIILGFALYRSRNAGKRVPSSTAPIPDASQRNERTRVDQDPTTMSDVNRKYNESTNDDDIARDR
ncbi:hypothetical protein KDA_13080 [Dictyobacter alpinus]|uniref:Uncharacterized protein n=1 Tax=Dictyobacter alpinus TaxID=2014873 RepID=A0A402B397_9CHLR|nr:hypothetical protein [Dictyobacter alpinus]GCE25824.1 hypothetical protein KDA_13080 [Dictyobacter alpinus]